MRFDNELKRLHKDFILDEEKTKKQEERNKIYRKKLLAELSKPRYKISKKHFRLLKKLSRDEKWFDNQYYKRGCPCFQALFLACGSYNLDKLWRFTMTSNGVGVDFEI